MKLKKYIITALALTLSFTACKKDEFSDENKKQIPGIEVVNGYLKFSSQQIFDDYIESIKSAISEPDVSTRSGAGGIQSIPNFASLREYKISKIMTRSFQEDDQLDFDPTLMLKAEKLLPDPVLEYVMDTTFRIQVGEYVYQITELGTFQVKAANIAKLDAVIAQFELNPADAQLLYEHIYSLDEEVCFMDSFGALSVQSGTNHQTLTFVTNADYSIDGGGIGGGGSGGGTSGGGSTSGGPPPTTMNTAQNTQYFGLQSYNTNTSGLWQWLFGMDNHRNNNFDSYHRAQAEIFDVNYGFYTSTGFKIKFQRKKWFWFIPYWVTDNCSDIAVGIEELEGKLTLNPIPNNFFVRSYNAFTHTSQGLINQMFYMGMGCPQFLTDWANWGIDQMLNFIVGTNGNIDIWKINPYQYTTHLTKDAVYAGLNWLTNQAIFAPIHKRILPSDPKIAYLFYGQPGGSQTRSYVQGLKIYGSGSSRVIYFHRAAGFTISWGGQAGLAIGPYLPTKFELISAKMFGAVKWNGQWRGIRFIHT